MTATTTSAKRARTTSMAFINSCTPPTLPRLPLLDLVVGAPLRSLDHLICPLPERRRDREAEGLGGLEVDNQIELGRLLDRKIGGLRTFANLGHIRGGMSDNVCETRPVRHKSPLVHV